MMGLAPEDTARLTVCFIMPTWLVDALTVTLWVEALDPPALLVVREAVKFPGTL